MFFFASIEVPWLLPEVQIMAPQSRQEAMTKWSVGSTCNVYCEDEHQWIQGEILHIFTHRNEQWLRVGYGPHVKDVRYNSPICVPLSKMQESKTPDPNINRLQQRLDYLSAARRAAQISIRNHFLPQSIIFPDRMCSSMLSFK